MKRILRMLGLAVVLSALLVVSITGAVFAAGDNAKGPQAQTQNQYEECPCEECPCGDGVCNEYCKDYSYKWGETEEPAPHGKQNGKI